MKKLLFPFFVISAILIAGCSCQVENTVICVQLDPLEKVFTEESYFVENPETAAVVKGETATFQFVIKSAFPIQGLKVDAGDLTNGDQEITATLKAFVGYIRAGVHAGVFGPQSKDAVFPVSDYYPDWLLEEETIDVQPLQNQPVWITYAISRDATDGAYSAFVTFSGKVNGKSFKITKQVNAKVYPVALPQQTLWVTNWWTSEGLSKINGDQPVEPYSDRYWELLIVLAHVMRNHGQNTYIFWDLPGLCNAEYTGTQYSFNFTHFDKMVELFIREGGLKRIEGGHLSGGRLDNCIGINVPKVGLRPFDNDTVQIFLSQFLPALYNHLETKGWENMYMQHIADEPIRQHIPSYISVAELVKKFMPGIPIIDAIDVNTTHEFANIVNLWVPILDQYHKNYDFFGDRQAIGEEVWFYTCCNPQGNYANRFLEQPLVQTRFLHWINYCYGATGFLHWGFNWWHLSPSNDVFNDGYCTYTWPASDAWYVYPVEGKVYTSIRLAAMRDGIADYELLKLLEQKDPNKAKEVAGEIIKDFNSYNSNVRAFRIARLNLLQWLSE